MRCMVPIKKDSINIVVIGRLNPQIVNIDFLMNNDIIPKDEAPFRDLLKSDRPFSKFVSTPVVVELEFDSIRFVVDVNRFLLMQTGVRDWSDSKVGLIASRYFKTLSYTPVTLVGFNLSCTVGPTTPTQDAEFQATFLGPKSRILKAIGVDRPVADITLRYPAEGDNARLSLTVSRPMKTEVARSLNLNYEFDFAGWDDFQKRLERIPEVGRMLDLTASGLLEGI